MRVVITGVGGFVGGHLLRHIRAEMPGAEVHGTILTGTSHASTEPAICHEIGLKDERAVHELIHAIQPDQIYHLAAQASPRASLVSPWNTLENNIQSQLNLFQACLDLAPKPRILIVSSGDIYGAPERLPVAEDTPFQPRNPYAVSKIAQDMLGLQYFITHQLPVVRVRPFNHIGPGQSQGFVAVDFAIQIAQIEAGQQAAILEVGNLSAQRDFTDVRDVVQAYWLVMNEGRLGEVYNVASGRSHSIQHLLDILLSYSDNQIEVRYDPKRMMQADVPIIQGDASRLRNTTGWQPTIPFEQSLLDVLNDCRERVKT